MQRMLFGWLDTLGSGSVCGGSVDSAHDGMGDCSHDNEWDVGGIGRALWAWVVARQPPWRSMVSLNTACAPAGLP